MVKQIVLESYKIKVDEVELEVNITDSKETFVRQYFLDIPEYGLGTKALLANLKRTIISDTSIQTEKMLDVKFIQSLKDKFGIKARSVLSKELPDAAPDTINILIGLLLQEMLGLGKIEFVLNDNNLEEVVINSSKDPIWVYHKKYGWLKTNISLDNESEVQNYAAIIARRVGKQITILNPLLDAHLITGDRANATLYPISSRGNTITIRKFRREPWTVTDFITNKTATSEVLALLWLSIEYELNILISGGTASGKTSFLNILMPFIQPNHRIISIEDTREIQLPEFMHWVPLTTREPNPEGKGSVQMIDLLVNSLRMRPDRLIVGEIRREREAEVLFEGMHTGHSAYTTVHANTAQETIRRLTNPPINIPTTMLDAVHLNVVMFRNRRIGARRVLQLAEFISEKRSAEQEFIKPNILYRWKASTDDIIKHTESIRLYDELSLHTGLTTYEITDALKKKQAILDWMVKNNIRVIGDVGIIMAEYYKDSAIIEELVEKNKKPDFIKEVKKT
jgi:archaeal flagellar protein FlaI